MRTVRNEVTAAGTYYIPVNRYCDDTVATVQVTGLTLTSVSWTIDNIRSGDPATAVNLPANGVAAASANWIAKTAEADGSYQWGHPIDSIRVVLGGTGSGTITVVQDTASSDRN
jgi:hypothetical protein